jgi:glyoxylase-like metal-dependent hydrolase (beta-lactamase superfamily II)
MRIVRILAPNPSVYTLEGTNSWVVGDGPTIVIDPGPDNRSHLDELERAAAPVAHVLITHHHEDHAEGAGAFAERVGAPLHAWHWEGAERIKDGARFSAGGAELLAIHAPGHSADHVAFHAPDDSALFTGDTVVGRGTTFIDPPDGDLARYLATLERLLALAPRTIYPGHGPVVLDAKGKLREYLLHRAEREREVVEALAAAPRTVEDLVAAIYAAYPPDVRPLAARLVTAHLMKLEAEGRAAKNGRGADATWTLLEPRSCARCGRPVKGRGNYCGSCLLTMLQEGHAPPAPAEEGSAPAES